MGTNRTVGVGVCDVWEEAEGAVFSLEKRRLLGGPCSTYERLLRMWSQAIYWVTKQENCVTDSSNKLKQDRFQLNIMKTFSLLGQLDIWTGPGGVRESPALQVLNTWLDKPQAVWSEFSVDPGLSDWTRNLLSFFQPQWFCVQHRELWLRALRNTLLTNSCP